MGDGGSWRAMTLTEPEVCKVDRRGRVHVPAARREALLDEWEGSGTSLPEFARLVGVKYATLARLAYQAAAATDAGGPASGAAGGGRARGAAVRGAGGNAGCRRRRRGPDRRAARRREGAGACRGAGAMG